MKTAAQLAVSTLALTLLLGAAASSSYATNIADLPGLAPLAMELLVRTTLGAKPVNR